MFFSAIMALFAGIYYFFPKVFGRFMNDTLGYVHFFITIASVFLIFLPVHYNAIDGMPLHYYDYSSWETLRQFVSRNKFVSIAVTISLFGQLLLVFNFLTSIWRGRKVNTISLSR